MADVSSLVWNKVSPPKISAFVWKAIQNRVPTGDKLLSRGVFLSEENLLCKGCGVNTESCWHILGECSFARKVWDLIYVWMQSPTPLGNNLVENMKLHGLINHGGRKEVWLSLWQCVIWNLWLNRNSSRFKGEILTHWQVVENIKVNWGSWLKARGFISQLTSTADWFLEPRLCLGWAPGSR